MPGRGLVCQAGRVEIVLAPHRLQRSRWPASGTVRVSGSASTLTSASRPQASHVAVTMWTPFWRMLARVIGGPGLARTVMRAAPDKRLADTGWSRTCGLTVTRSSARRIGGTNALSAR